MTVARAFEPPMLEKVRQFVDLAGCKLVPINDPKAWELFAENKTGPHHSWRHKATGWLSQTLSVPRDLLESQPSTKTAQGRGK